MVNQNNYFWVDQLREINDRSLQKKSVLNFAGIIN